MKKHTYRTILIWAAIIVSLLTIYPTVGWMVMSEATREAKLAQWKQEDEARALEKRSYFKDLGYKVKRWAECDRNRVINLGLDLQGGIQMVLSFDWHELAPEKIEAYRQDPNIKTDEKIEELVQEIVYQQLVNRINKFEAKEPIIQKLGTNQIQVQLPGEKDTDRAIKLMTQAAVLNFHIVAGPDETVQVFKKIKQEYPNEFSSFLERPAPGEPIWVKPENYPRVKALVDKIAKIPGVLPEDKILAFSRPPKIGDPQRYDLYLLDKKPIASGEGIRSATSMPDPQNPSHWAIAFSNDAAGAEIFGKATEANIGRPMAIVLDDQVVSAPTINGRIDSNGQITGRFDADEARDLSIALNSGSMVVKVREDSTDVVSANLGADSVRSGVLSSLTGLAVLGVATLVYYLVPGALAVLTLILNAILIVAAMAYFNLTLTLPGIAGLILTIGMAVDANVLIYERIREEIRNGHSVLAAIETGFSRAAVTIIDSNVTTFIAAIVLFQFGTGPIEGFAIALSIGVLGTLFTGLVVGHALFDFFYGRKIVSSLKMLSVVKHGTKFPFMGIRHICMSVSVVLVLSSLGLFAYKLNQGTMLGVDFTQGTNIRIELKQDEIADIGALRTALDGAGFTGPTVQQMYDKNDALTNKFQVRVGDVDAKDKSDDMPTVASRIRTALTPLVGGDESKIEFSSVKTVGAAVGAQLRSDAVWAVIWSILFITIYVGFRFKTNYAIGSIVALVHDVCITLGVFAVCDRQISLAVVAAILTIIGYSLNDTIVVFDRIREDMDKLRGRGMSLTEIFDYAINETLSRTLMTSGFTIIVVIFLFLFGGADIEDFALAMIVGIIVGTYSSIFIASPYVVLWEKYFGRENKITSKESTKVDESGRRYISKKKRAKKSGTEGEASA